MKNIITKGAEILTVKNDPLQKSSESVIINEDYSMVVQVTGYYLGKVEGYKVWDIDKTKKFYAAARYNGQGGYPTDMEIEIGSYVVFHRVGDFNSQGVAGFELHTENSTNSSFVCFIAKPSV